MPAPLSGLSVLLVEDDEELCTLTTLVLEEEGATVRAARSRLELERLEPAFCPQLALLDARLPDSDGAEVSAIVRTAWPSAVQVLVSGDVERVEEWKRDGGWVLSKPYDLGELIVTVARASGRRVVA